MADRYKKHVSGWVRPHMKGFKLSCCDCCLVHVFEFRVVNGKPEFRFERDNRATMNKRRHTPVVARKTVAAQLRAMKRSAVQHSRNPGET